METTWDEETATALRAALYARRGAIVDLVRGRLTDEVLHMVGDALVTAIDDHLAGAREVAAECTAALRVRDWTGDEMLADQLEAALGMSPTPLLRPLAVDLEELASVLEGDPVYGGGRIDLRTGDTWPAMIADEVSTTTPATGVRRQLAARLVRRAVRTAHCRVRDGAHPVRRRSDDASQRGRTEARACRDGGSAAPRPEERGLRTAAGRREVRPQRLAYRSRCRQCSVRTARER